MTRIIGGIAGGRRLVTPAGRNTRPTSDRVREGLFSSLGGDLSGRSFLDLYAGSGAVGLEAASRGAAPVLLVEREAKALRAARDNVAALGLDVVAVRADDVVRFLREHEPTPYDVLFLDPPYADDVDAVLTLIADGGWVASGGDVVVERDSRGAPPQWPAGIEADRSRRYGDSTLWYGRRP
ncbi:MAG: 16S rRNA (guanine(966)-N(2))-methyltransferase RsmD [Frankiaceae bacterium]|nr:16S rRNA (guanine(966)-N(2))-methyltransferase RsmD [Frankiaceae bacterium]